MAPRSIWAALVASGLAALAARRFERFAVVDHSMLPTLRPADRLLAGPLRRTWRGDLVVFEHPARPGFHLVKRLVGLPGETLQIAEGRVRVNGTRLEEPWASGEPGGKGTWQLGPEEVFLLGDQRSWSADDGRTLGPLPLSAIRWRVVLRYRPFERIRLL